MADRTIDIHVEGNWQEIAQLFTQAIEDVTVQVEQLRKTGEALAAIAERLA